MGFTLKMLLPPFVSFVLLGLAIGKAAMNNTTGPIALLIMAWGGIAFVIVMFYWIGRAWKRATRDSPDTYRPR